MNREQQVVLSLLKEIDTICKKNKITYYLSPRLTLCAVNGLEFSKSPTAGRVLMKVSDMERFRQAFEAEPPKRRFLESMKNNKYFPGFYLRYTNMDTLCCRLNEGRNFGHPGFGVDIFPLRGKTVSGKRHKLNRILETGWQQMSDNYTKTAKAGRRARFCGSLVRILCLGGRKHLGRKLYEEFCGSQDVPDTTEYIYRVNEDTACYFDAEVFEETREVMLGGESFLAPKETEAYLTKIFGEDYGEIPAEKYVPGSSVIVSALVSYEDYFSEIEPSKKFLKARRKNYKAESRLRKRREYLNWCWEYAKFCGDRRSLSLLYLKEKDYIRNLYENGDCMRLEAVFRPYTRMMRKSLQENEVYIADEEIFEIYLAYIEAAGYKKLMEQIEKCQY